MRLRKRVGAAALSSILVMTSVSPAMAEELVSEVSEQVVSRANALSPEV